MKNLIYSILVFSLSPLILLAQTPSCSGTWGPPIVSQNFGQGNTTDNWYGPLATYAPGASTSTIFVGTAGPIGGVLSDGYSGLAKMPSASGQGNWISATDHTGNTDGLMFLINAPSTAATVFFEYTMDNLCPNTTLKLSVWILNANEASLTTNPTYQYPNMTIQAVDPVTMNVLGTTPSGDVAADSVWHEYSMIFNNGNNASVLLQLVNNSVGSGFGNDLAIDDISVQPCVPISHLLPKIDTLICQNTALDFTANVQNPPYNPIEYQWQYSLDGGITWIDDGSPSNGNAHTFNAMTANSGTYLIRYKAGPQGGTANNNCIAISDTSKVIVSDPPVAPVINYIDRYCTGQPFEPFTIVSGTNTKWYDSLSGGTGSNTIPVINTSIPGTYSWYVSQTTPQGCESIDRTPVSITVTQTPHADFDFSINYGCEKDTVQFQNNALHASTYYWDFNDGTHDTMFAPRHLYPQGNYLVMAVAQNGSCSDTVYHSLVLSHPLEAAFSASEDTICVGSTVNFINNSTATSNLGIDPSYFWDFRDGHTDITQNPVHQFATPGEFKVMLIGTNFVPCQDTAFKFIYVDSLPRLSFTSDLTKICMGDQITFTANYVYNGLKNLKWNFGYSADTIFDVNPVHASFDAPGTYNISLLADYRVCPDTAYNSSVTVNQLPVIQIGPDTTMCLDGEPVVLKDKVNSGNLNAHWLWSTGDTTASVTVKHYGLYQARVTIDQCSATDEVNIRKDCYIDIPNSFTPNGDGENDYFFPRQFLTHGLVSFSMDIYNRWGEKLFETHNPTGRGWDGAFNSKVQPVGVYIYQIKVVMKNKREENYTGNVTLLR